MWGTEFTEMFYISPIALPLADVYPPLQPRPRLFFGVPILIRLGMTFNYIILWVRIRVKVLGSVNSNHTLALDAARPRSIPVPVGGENY